MCDCVGVRACGHEEVWVCGHVHVDIKTIGFEISFANQGLTVIKNLFRIVPHISFTCCVFKLVCVLEEVVGLFWSLPKYQVT